MDKPLLDLYADYLISSFGPTTATGLSRLLGAGLSHDKITRFLSGEAMTSQHLWQIVKPLVRQAQNEDAVLIVDDSIVQKPHTDENELICWHFDHSLDKTVKGINFVTALYCAPQPDGEEVSLPVSFALVQKTQFYQDKSGKTKRRDPVSKNEHYQTMLKACAHNQLVFRYVLNDVWFASSENMTLIKTELKKDFVMPVTPIKPQDQPQGGFVRARQKARLLQGSRNTATRTGCPPAGLAGAGGFSLLLLKQVFTNKDKSQGILYLVTSDTTLDGSQITHLYQRRWQPDHSPLPETVAGGGIS